MATEKIRVDKVSPAKSGKGVWIKQDSDLYFIKDVDASNIKEGDIIEVENTGTGQTKAGNVFQVASMLRKLNDTLVVMADGEGEDIDDEMLPALEPEEKTHFSKEFYEHPKVMRAIKNIRYVEEKIKEKLYNVDEQIRACIVATITGQNVLLVGPAGSGKTMMSQLVASAFIPSNKILFREIQRGTERTDIVGEINIKKWSEEGRSEPNSEFFESALAMIFDEFYNSKPELRSVFNNLMVTRETDLMDKGRVKVNARVIFATANLLEDITDREVLEYGGYAIADRFNFIMSVPRVGDDALVQIIMQALDRTQSGYAFPEPIAHVRDLDIVKNFVYSLKPDGTRLFAVPKWAAILTTKFLGQLTANLEPAYVPSPRKLEYAVVNAITNAVLEGRTKLTDQDLKFALVNSIYVNRLDPEDADRVKIIDEIANNVFSLSSDRMIQLFTEASKAMSSGETPKEWVNRMRRELDDFTDDQVTRTVNYFTETNTNYKITDPAMIDYINYTVSSEYNADAREIDGKLVNKVVEFMSTAVGNPDKLEI